MERTVTIENLSDHEIECAEDALSEIDDEHEMAWKDAVANSGSAAKVYECFEPGTHGHHEIIAISHVVLQNWNEFVLEHPSITMNLKAYRAAKLAEYFMAMTYSKMGSMPYTEYGEPTDERE